MVPRRSAGASASSTGKTPRLVAKTGVILRGEIPGEMPGDIECRAVPLYRVYFKNQHAFIIGRDDFLAVDDEDATVIARTLADACADLCASVELWQGARRVDTSPEQIIPNANEIAARVQNIVLERELVMRESKSVVAESARLLKETERLLAFRRRPALK